MVGGSNTFLATVIYVGWSLLKLADNGQITFGWMSHQIIFFGKVFAENPVIEIVLPFKWVSMYIFLRMYFFRIGVL